MKRVILFTIAIGVGISNAFAGGGGTGMSYGVFTCPGADEKPAYVINFSENSGWWYTDGTQSVAAKSWNIGYSSLIAFEDGARYVTFASGKGTPGVLMIGKRRVSCVQRVDEI